MRGRLAQTGRWITLLGVLLQGAGLGVAALRPAGQPAAGGDALAATGGPGHVLFLAGLALTLAGLLLVGGAALAGRAEAGSRGALRAVGAVVVAAVLILA